VWPFLCLTAIAMNRQADIFLPRRRGTARFVFFVVLRSSFV
jgi:hypothetical protein